MAPLRRAIIIVADGAGCGGAPDAAAYGDAGADTLGNVARAVGGLSSTTRTAGRDEGNGAISVALGTAVTNPPQPGGGEV